MLMHHTLESAKSQWNPESHWLVNGSFLQTESFCMNYLFSVTSLWCTFVNSFLVVHPMHILMPRAHRLKSADLMNSVHSSRACLPNCNTSWWFLKIPKSSAAHLRISRGTAHSLRTTALYYILGPLALSFSLLIYLTWGVLEQPVVMLEQTSKNSSVMLPNISAA